MLRFGRSNIPSKHLKNEIYIKGIYDAICRNYRIALSQNKQFVKCNPVVLSIPQNISCKRYTDISFNPQSFYFYCFILMAASTNPRNSGCGRLGLDFNSGWACVAIYQGCSGISTISTIRPSGESPHSFMPCSVRTER